MHFVSDTMAGVAPEILSAIERANDGTFMGYEEDPVSKEAKVKFSEVFETEVQVFFVATGSASNSLALSVMSPPYGAIFAHESAHINVDECGAPEFYTQGAKIAGIPGERGKISPEGVQAALKSFPKGVVHRMQPGGLSLSQATEKGSLYSLDEIAALSDFAKSKGIAAHMDGARFANALVSLGCSPAEMTWKAGIDVLSFGATKNGALMAEAVVFFNPDLVKDFAYRQKRGGHLFSKSRFTAAQFLGYFENDLWLKLAGHANAMAAKLGEGLAALPGYELEGSVQTNQVFVVLPRDEVRKLQKAGAQFYIWAGDPSEPRQMVRLVCSWKTTEDQVDAFLAAARS